MELFLYRIDPQTRGGRELRGVAGALGITCHELGEDALGETIGYLTGQPGFTPRDTTAPVGEAIETELLLMQGLTDEQRRILLHALRELGIAIRLKAVATATNCQWTLGHLLAELDQEDRLLKSQQA